MADQVDPCRLTWPRAFRQPLVLLRIPNDDARLPALWVRPHDPKVAGPDPAPATDSDRNDGRPPARAAVSFSRTRPASWPSVALQPPREELDERGSTPRRTSRRMMAPSLAPSRWLTGSAVHRTMLTMRPTRLLVVGLLCCVTACASLKHSTSPGAGEGTTLHQLDELAFEVPANWKASESGDGVGFVFCAERDSTSCAFLSVALTDLFESGCDKTDVVAQAVFQGWRLNLDPSQLRATTLADHAAWRADRGSFHALVICGGKRSWFIRTIAFDDRGGRHMSSGFERLIETLRFNPALAPKP